MENLKKRKNSVERKALLAALIVVSLAVNSGTEFFRSANAETKVEAVGSEIAICIERPIYLAQPPTVKALEIELPAETKKVEKNTQNEGSLEKNPDHSVKEPVSSGENHVETESLTVESTVESSTEEASEETLEVTRVSEVVEEYVANVSEMVDTDVIIASENTEENVSETTVDVEVAENIFETVDETTVDSKPTLQNVTTYSSITDKIKASMAYLVEDCGFTLEGAAGILGNVAIESGYNTYADNGCGYHGLCQWNTNYGWWYDIQNWISSNGYDVYSFEWQIKAIVNCPSRGRLNDERLEELKGLTNVDQATEYFSSYYEGCSYDLYSRKYEAIVAWHVYVDDIDYYGNK